MVLVLICSSKVSKAFLVKYHAVDQTIKEPIMLHLRNKMNDNILSSNKLLADFLPQYKHVLPQGHASKRTVLQSDF